MRERTCWQNEQLNPSSQNKKTDVGLLVSIAGGLKQRTFTNPSNTMVKISKVGISLPYYSTVNECVVNELVAVNEKKRARANETSPGPLSSEAKVQPTRVASVPTLSCNLQDNDRRMPLKKRMKRSESSMLPVQEHPKQKQESVTTSNAKGKMRPEECIKSIVQASGVSIESIKVDLNSFLPIEKQQHSSYPQAALAARNEDITSLKSLHKEGHNLQCSNKFGESIIHIICRRRRDDILNFLVSEAGVSLRLRDDLGRTPLHDAAW